MSSRTDEHVQLGAGLKPDVVEQATEAVSARLGTTAEVALELMQGLARSQSRELDEFAAKVLASGGRLDQGE